MKLWSVAELDKAEAKKIQKRYGLPAIAALLLQIRNITGDDEIKDFLSGDSSVADPFEIKDMDKAVRRVKNALDFGERICVYGDYDADGVTSTALLYSYLEASGANAVYYIPSREKEGYGMNKSAVDKLNDMGVKLIITVDNGIAAAREVEYAASLGIDTVVTDHHVAPEKLPNACAVVDPHRKDCPCKFKELSGVGVVFKLVMALERDYGDTETLLDNYSDLLSIGTIGDVVELKSENRVFVKHGLNSMNNTGRVGLMALINAVGLQNKALTSTNVSFAIVPRINAVGRLGDSEKSVRLLLSDDYDEACEIAGEMSEYNARRQSTERDILLKIDGQIRENPSLTLDKIIVIDGENWHNGVVGLAAQKVREAFGKPSIVLSRSGDEAKGSGRSVEGFPLCDAVFACSDLLLHSGGHPMAVGLALKSENIAEFRRRINEFADAFGEMPFDRIKIDCKLNPSFVNLDLVNALSYIQPFGAGNPMPIFGLYNMTLKNIIPLSNNKHLRLTFSREGATITALKFFTCAEDFPYKPGEALDLAVNLERSDYNGRASVSVIIKDLKPAHSDTKELLSSGRAFEDLSAGKKLTQSGMDDLTPNRNDFALLYRYLKSVGKFSGKAETLVHTLDNRLSFGKIRVILKAMRELGLIELSCGLKSTDITVLPVKSKVSIESAPVMKKLRMV